MHLSMSYTVRKLKGSPTMLKEKSNTDCLKSSNTYLHCINYNAEVCTLKEIDWHQFYVPLFE